MKELQTTDGTILGETSAMIDHVRQFYKNLYSVEPIDRETASDFLNASISTLTRYESESLNNDITLAEIKAAIKSLKKKKCPGLDGLSAEFYQKYAEKLAPILKTVYDFCMSRGYLTDAMQCGLICLIYKGKGDRLYLENWRPITLLNVDYKIPTKI